MADITWEEGPEPDCDEEPGAEQESFVPTDGDRKIVINKRIGGYSLSHRVILEYATRKGLKLFHQRDEEVHSGEYYCYWLDVQDQEHEWYPQWDIKRDDPLLVEIVEELGSAKSSGPFASLKVVTIPGDVRWEIHEADSGVEWIAEQHRKWY